ncbi:transposase [Streptomyces sp. NPDC056638]|uniref:transposase n=1 Tax=Streptomyces sp. NPDC056638 TaxID=3345887 RepID=UPI00369471F7
MEETVLRLEELLFPSIADIAVLSVDVNNEAVLIEARCTLAGANCAGCRGWSERVHSSYLRFPADVPSAGKRVRLCLRVRRFICGNASCERRTFVEQIAGLTRRYGRWTERLRSTLAAVGLALAGRAGARLAGVFGVAVSCSTVLRLVEALPDPDPPVPRVVGVDEYATRKGRFYGTVLVDVETRRPVDLLPDRNASSLAAWLAERPGIPPEKTGSPWPTGHRFADRIRDRHAIVHTLLEAGRSRRSIGRQLRMTHRTVKRLADAIAPEDLFQGQWQNRPTVLDEYKPYLDDRWNQGCTNAWALWEEIVPFGYKGSYQRVRAYLREKRLSPGPVSARPPSPRTVSGWILRHPESLTESEQLRLKAVLAHCRELDALTGHVRSFAQMLTEREGERLPEWLDAARQDDLLTLHTLAAGIDRDRDAVIAGLTLPWSSGVVEGHVNRIKILKRQMFGRAASISSASVSCSTRRATVASLPRVLADEPQVAMCRVSSRDFCCSAAVHSFAWGSEAVLR